MGFGNRFTRWIMWCVTTATISVIVNSSACEPFRIQRGFRQGDPLSSLLFIIVSEYLTFVIKKHVLKV